MLAEVGLVLSVCVCVCDVYTLFTSGTSISICMSLRHTSLSDSPNNLIGSALSRSLRTT